MFPIIINIINEYQLTCSYNTECNKSISSLSVGKLFFNPFCYEHKSNYNYKKLDRKRFTIEEMQNNVPTYLTKLYENLVAGNGVQLFISSQAGKIQNAKGSIQTIELETFIDFSETMIGFGFLLIYLLRVYKDQCLNNSGISQSTSTGNIRMFASIFAKKNFPKRNEFFASISNYTASFDELDEYGKNDANDIYEAVIKFEQESGRKDFFVTEGATLDHELRKSNYEDMMIYQDIGTSHKLKCTPAHFSAADIAIREFLGIFYCLIHHYLCNKMTNKNGGGEMIRNMAILDYENSGSYFHCTIPGIPLMDVNIVKSHITNICSWKSSKYHLLELLSPTTIDRISLKYSHLMVEYNKKLEQKRKRFDKYPPIFNENGTLDFQKTFAYDKLFTFLKKQLKLDKYLYYKCEGCHSTFKIINN
jgi:hypothetical protein